MLERSSLPLEVRLPRESQADLKQETPVRLLWNDQSLNAAYKCEDNDIVAHFMGSAG